MIHWLSTALNTYLLHSQHGNGYQWWSGPGSDLGEATLIGAVLAAAKHHTCHQKRCWRLGHAHPEHGRPTCARHYHHQPELG